MQGDHPKVWCPSENHGEMCIEVQEIWQRLWKGNDERFVMSAQHVTDVLRPEPPPRREIRHVDVRTKTSR